MSTPELGSYNIAMSKGAWVDEARDGRTVPYKIYIPVLADGEKTPVILWSHGFGGSRDGAAFLARYLASYGYHLVHLTHVGTDTSLWEGKDGHPWDILRETKVPREVTLQRFTDINFVLNELQRLPMAESMDFERVGMSGHSFGALSTQVALGQMFPDEDEVYQSYIVDRIQAGISYSPVPIDHLGPDDVEVMTPEAIYGPIEKPVLMMTGTQDSSPIGGAPYTHRFPVFDYAQVADKFMLVKQDGDHMVYNGTRGKLDKNVNRARHEDMIKVVSKAFWDVFLKQDRSAKVWLEGEGVLDYLSSDGELYAGSRD